ncbi:hypothetical protein HUO09_17300 [Vibrio sp. Y2-5]|uniref:hypothetical protein n=1 Tax=Vibrio sp. Y2-5 TaxID=2743977 RepID=UPI00166112A4|nr:hypothetical protein [Vibrio sp. Y2-5]MBD0788113.1 hypothetical protein [Vibrio sp. Y2-5]
MENRSVLKSEQSCSLVKVEQCDIYGNVISTSFLVIDENGQEKPYSSLAAANSAYANRVYEAEQRLGYSSPSMGM